ncbi:HK97 family phage prohead protease [Nitrobacter sp.]|uniref:HK97 family phage prohead protease n=1 Tax=Nitrobacter sp. TaxID=29420 RepID=UPI0029CAB2BE|nr:HK97 family phage prohead protease [Nitrobacter sp.]
MHAPLSSVPRLSFSGDGAVEGYASLFGEIDQARDMMMPGAFAQTLKAKGLRRIPMLFQHDPSEPVGIWLELREDFRGLWARGKLIPDVARARELLALVEAGAVDGLSIGYRTVRGRIEPRTRVRKLYQVDLWEISIVTFPLLAGARVRAVKQATPPSPCSRVRTQAERGWRSMTEAADEPAPRLRPRPAVASLRGREARRAALHGALRAQMAGVR